MWIHISYRASEARRPWGTAAGCGVAGKSPPRWRNLRTKPSPPDVPPGPACARPRKVPVREDRPRPGTAAAGEDETRDSCRLVPPVLDGGRLGPVDQEITNPGRPTTQDHMRER